ncbi:uncharacterized protein LOC111334634 [Stylophora pistillata]|uniref:uncharacterized protein LOC111334634 n=1 Tax=Stylophora pistillata TaxID=50429 RepID=UPI000C049EC0|nr:uncharacterized protein LOC111334634 [Stylophora pistillata]
MPKINSLLAKFILTPGPTDEIPVKVSPLVAAIRSTRYVHVKEIYIWDVPMKHEDIATLALLLEQSIYPIQYLELLECSINSYGVDRLERSICMSNLTALVLDYNKFGDYGCSGLCRGLFGNRVLLRLSLCYCDLGPQSGELLGKTISNTSVRDLYLDGNFLECEGVIELIKLIADTAEMEAIERAERKDGEIADSNSLTVPGVASAMSSVSRASSSVSVRSKPGSASSRMPSTGKMGKKGKKKKSAKKKKEPSPPPVVGPWIQKLHLLNNGIDGHGLGSTLGPVMCMKMFRKLITHSESLQELDLDDNAIGDLGGREILEALMDRKEGGLSPMKINVSHRLNSSIFAEINKLGSGLKKKGKKSKGKPGKKRI